MDRTLEFELRHRDAADGSVSFSTLKVDASKWGTLAWSTTSSEPNVT